MKMLNNNQADKKRRYLSEAETHSHGQLSPLDDHCKMYDLGKIAYFTCHMFVLSCDAHGCFVIVMCVSRGVLCLSWPAMFVLD